MCPVAGVCIDSGWTAKEAANPKRHRQIGISRNDADTPVKTPVRLTNRPNERPRDARCTVQSSPGIVPLIAGKTLGIARAPSGGILQLHLVHVRHRQPVWGILVSTCMTGPGAEERLSLHTRTDVPQTSQRIEFAATGGSDPTRRSFAPPERGRLLDAWQRAADLLDGPFDRPDRCQIPKGNTRLCGTGGPTR